LAGLIYDGAGNRLVSSLRQRTPSVTDITSHQRGPGVQSQRLAYQGSGLPPPRSMS
jgi:hypothetical protein